MSFQRSITFALAAAATLAAGAALAQASDLKVTITNITKGQPLSPPVVVSHRDSVALAVAGETASDGIRIVAEDGDPAPLAQALEGLREVRDVAVAGGPVFPGESTTLFLRARGSDVISAVGMLINTNDAFFFLDSYAVPRRSGSVGVAAWDSGTEANSEVCSDVPGPACGDTPNNRNTELAEGFVHVHRGVQGANVDAEGEASGLRPELYDWRNPSVLVTIERARRGEREDDDE